MQVRDLLKEISFLLESGTLSLDSDVFVFHAATNSCGDADHAVANGKCLQVGSFEDYEEPV
tara:strand:- start:26 stop:208 length:183 start_codon:yes stop_codon:yes gene_type:complete